MTALHLSILHSKTDVALELIQSGANLHIIDHVSIHLMNTIHSFSTFNSQNGKGILDYLSLVNDRESISKSLLEHGITESDIKRHS